MVGWYRPDQGAGLIGAVVGAVVVLFIWHRLVSSGAISDPGSAALALGRMNARRGARRSTTTARCAPERPVMVKRLTSLR